MSQFKKAVPTAKQIQEQQAKQKAGQDRMNKAADKILELRKGPSTAETRGMEEAQQMNGAIGRAMRDGAEKKLGQLNKQAGKALTGNKMGAAKANAPSPATMQPKQGAAPGKALSAPAPKILGAQPAPQRLPAPPKASGGASPATLTGAPKQGAPSGSPLSAPAKKTLSPQPAPQKLPTMAKPASPARPANPAPGQTAFKPGVIGNPNRASSPKIGNKG